MVAWDEVGMNIKCKKVPKKLFGGVQMFYTLIMMAVKQVYTFAKLIRLYS